MKRMEPRRDDGAYTMERLQRAVTQLVAAQGQLLGRIEELEKTLSERDHRVTQLEHELRTGEEKRFNAIERIDALIDLLDELEGRAESAAQSGADAS